MPNFKECNQLTSNRGCNKSRNNCVWRNKKCWKQNDAPAPKNGRTKSSCKDIRSRVSCVNPNVPGRDCKWTHDKCLSKTMTLPPSFLAALNPVPKQRRSPGKAKSKSASPQRRKKPTSVHQTPKQKDVSSNYKRFAKLKNKEDIEILEKLYQDFKIFPSNNMSKQQKQIYIKGTDIGEYIHTDIVPTLTKQQQAAAARKPKPKQVISLISSSSASSRSPSKKPKSKSPSYSDQSSLQLVQYKSPGKAKSKSASPQRKQIQIKSKSSQQQGSPYKPSDFADFVKHNGKLINEMFGDQNREAHLKHLGDYLTIVDNLVYKSKNEKQMNDIVVNLMKKISSDPVDSGHDLPGGSMEKERRKSVIDQFQKDVSKLLNLNNQKIKTDLTKMMKPLFHPKNKLGALILLFYTDLYQDDQSFSQQQQYTSSAKQFQRSHSNQSEKQRMKKLQKMTHQQMQQYYFNLGRNGQKRVQRSPRSRYRANIAAASNFGRKK